MNKRNQIEAQRAVKRFEAKTAGGNLAVHMMLARGGNRISSNRTGRAICGAVSAAIAL